MTIIEHKPLFVKGHKKARKNALTRSKSFGRVKPLPRFLFAKIRIYSSLSKYFCGFVAFFHGKVVFLRKKYNFCNRNKGRYPRRDNFKLSPLFYKSGFGHSFFVSSKSIQEKNVLEILHRTIHFALILFFLDSLALVKFLLTTA